MGLWEVVQVKVNHLMYIPESSAGPVSQVAFWNLALSWNSDITHSFSSSFLSSLKPTSSVQRIPTVLSNWNLCRTKKTAECEMDKTGKYLWSSSCKISLRACLSHSALLPTGSAVLVSISSYSHSFSSDMSIAFSDCYSSFLLHGATFSISSFSVCMYP